MTAPLNGTPAAAPRLDPKGDIAQAVYLLNWEPGDTPWEGLEDDLRADLVTYAEQHVSEHVKWLAARGFRIVAPNAVLRPQSEQEALAMVQAAKDFFDAQRRKGKLMAAPKKLIIPGAH